MSGQVTAYFTNKKLAGDYLDQIKQKWPRYLRDHLQVILKSLEGANMDTADQTLDFCLKNKIFHGREFEQTLQVFIDENPRETASEDQIKPLNKSTHDIDHVPQTSNIDDYEKIINPKNDEK
jgi:hypothetical protein